MRKNRKDNVRRDRRARREKGVRHVEMREEWINCGGKGRKTRAAD